MFQQKSLPNIDPLSFRSVTCHPQMKCLLIFCDTISAPVVHQQDLTPHSGWWRRRKGAE